MLRPGLSIRILALTLPNRNGVQLDHYFKFVYTVGEEGKVKAKIVKVKFGMHFN